MNESCQICLFKQMNIQMLLELCKKINSSYVRKEYKTLQLKNGLWKEFQQFELKK